MGNKSLPLSTRSVGLSHKLTIGRRRAVSRRHLRSHVADELAVRQVDPHFVAWLDAVATDGYPDMPYANSKGTVRVLATPTAAVTAHVDTPRNAFR